MARRKKLPPMTEEELAKYRFDNIIALMAEDGVTAENWREKWKEESAELRAKIAENPRLAFIEPLLYKERKVEGNGEEEVVCDL